MSQGVGLASCLPKTAWPPTSREHAALAPLYLGVKGVIAKSFARIHKANLINNGIVPMTFVDEADYDKINHFDELVISDIKAGLKAGVAEVVNKTAGYSFKVNVELTQKEIEVIEAGGRLNYVKMNA